MNSVVTPTFPDLLPVRQKAEISFDLAMRDHERVIQPVGNQKIDLNTAIIPNCHQREFMNKPYFLS
jgi:hypothetical protein